jgi:hypothetical protein
MKKSNKETFIIKSINKHGDKCDYSLVEYVNNNTKVKIICRVHGTFEQIPRTHLNGRAHGCGKCANNDYRYTLSRFIDRANLVHKNKYDYSLIEHVDRRSYIDIICPIHGIFSKRTDSHIEGSGCSKCNKKINFMLSEKKFIEKSKLIHNCFYDYSLVKYIGTNNYVKIICQKHGIFNQSPHNHMKGQGCPSCNESKGEKAIKEFLEKNNIKFIREKVFSDCRFKYPLPFDFYLPDYNTCIEFNGKQHYEPIKYFGGIDYFKLINERDEIKSKYCNENNIRLIIIKYNENIINSLKNNAII